MDTKREQKCTIQCHNCGKEFHSSRCDAKFCSQRCRRIVMEKRQAIYDFEVEFYKRLHILEMQVNDPDLGSDAFYVLTEIERRLCKANQRASKTATAKRLSLEG